MGRKNCAYEELLTEVDPGRQSGINPNSKSRVLEYAIDWMDTAVVELERLYAEADALGVPKDELPTCDFYTSADMAEIDRRYPRPVTPDYEYEARLKIAEDAEKERLKGRAASR